VVVGRRGDQQDPGGPDRKHADDRLDLLRAVHCRQPQGRGAPLLAIRHLRPLLMYMVFGLPNSATECILHSPFAPIERAVETGPGEPKLVAAG
jgi:hypothetical protein